MSEPQALRADAQRNRARVIAAAEQVFASDGLSVPVSEIARRAGVGTGTVSRHFPTKEALFEAILRGRLEDLTSHADRLAADEVPGDAFALFFGAVVRAGAKDRGLAERMAAAAGNRDTLGARVGAQALCDKLGEMLERAQQAGAVRPDVSLPDVEALMIACMSRDQRSIGPIIDVVTAGLRA